MKPRVSRRAGSLADDLELCTQEVILLLLRCFVSKVLSSSFTTDFPKRAVYEAGIFQHARSTARMSSRLTFSIHGGGQERIILLIVALSL